MRKQGRFSTGKFDIDNPKIFNFIIEPNIFARCLYKKWILAPINIIQKLSIYI